ncbi:hypothetical protein ACQ4PT_027191 [Festuca glaucescens]
MEKGKGLARRWAVELHDASSSSSSAFPDPPGFTRSAPEADDAATARQRKEAEATWKGQKAWEVAQAPFKNLMMMGFMMWMAGSTVHLFSIGIVFSALWQPFNALRSVGKVFEPFKDPRVDTLAPKLLFIALNLAAMGLGVWKLNTLGLLPTNASDWVSSLSPAREVEYAGGGIPLIETRTSCSSQAPAESVNEISDDEVEEVPAVATRRLTSDVWLEMSKKMVCGKPTAICNYCHKELTAGAKSGTSHLRDHLNICTQRMLKLRKDIIGRHDKEKMKAIEYMTMLQSRVAVTTDMWTADNQKKGYMAVTGHFIDESWKLRSILMGFIYVPAPHTGDVIAEELHETLMQWNLDEKLLTVIVDNCTSNDKAVDLMISKIGKSKLLLQDSVVADLHRLIEEYELDGDEYQQEEECSLSEKPAPAIMSFFHDIVAQQKPAAARLQGEIEHYLSDDLVPYTEKFNV